jgi:tetratricopeptide (TPR) repeat protein
MKKPYLLIITAILYLVLTADMSLAKDSDVETIEALKQAVKINPDSATAHTNLGYAYIKSGMYKEAIEALKQAVKINPDFAMAHIILGAVYVFLNDRDSAFEQYKILENLDSGMANELYNIINE